ncbi:pyridoxamine 5'-phosphate oxidase family protein, partial [Candidatus Dojkabacteria bacterium]|nr:pyridoxamine 5'-phosphate oxidase family protein [Candidatus Dojkabacteria bacterium]
DFTLYFMTHKDSCKAKALIDNPQISLSIWEKHKMLVQVDGNVEEIENQGHVEKYLDKLAEVSAKDPEFWPPLLKVKGNGYTVFKIIPKWLRSMDLEGDEMKQKESPFTEITFE